MGSEEIDKPIYYLADEFEQFVTCAAEKAAKVELRQTSTLLPVEELFDEFCAEVDINPLKTVELREYLVERGIL